MAPIVQAENNSVWDFVNKHKIALAAAGALAVGAAGYIIYNANQSDSTSSSSGSSKSSKKNKKRKNKKKANKEKSSFPVDEQGLPNITDEYVKSLPAEQQEEISLALKEQGNVAFKDKDFEKAISFYSGALQVKPSEVFYSNRSACYAALEDFEKVIEDTTAALKIKPDYSKCLLRRATAYEHLKKFDDAMFDLTGLTLYGGFNQDMINKTLERNLRSLSEEIVEKQEKNRVPTLPSPVYVTSFFSGFQADAKIVAELEEKNPEQGSGNFFLLKALENLAEGTSDSYDLMDSYINQAVNAYGEIASGDENAKYAAIALEYAGALQFLKNSDSEGLLSLDKALELSPRARTYVMKALISSDSNNFNDAFSLFATAVEMEPENADIYYQRGQMYFLNNDYTNAKENFVKAKELDENSVYAYIQLACMEHTNGDAAESTRLFSEARKKFPTSPEIPNYYGEILMSQNKLAEAMDEFDISYGLQKASKTVSIGALPLVHKAGVYALQQDLEKSGEFFQRAIDEDYRSEEAKLGLGQIKLQQEKIEEAIALFEEASKLCRNRESKISATSYAEAAKMQIRVSQDPVMKKKINEMMAAYGGLPPQQM
ncbi:protein channel [Saccharomycopsis crataegensis]|uniref:Protein channel n=1 Tax=Saccharomycopsis crataegensis TaxID=43959 RepID=A0AAV5QL75_9ASCO|nr:protein channel [Saccharomycopsis crataegensis]